MHFSRTPLLASFVALAVRCSARATGKATTYSYTEHEHGVETSDEWDKQGDIPEESSVPVRIGLTQSNLEKGHDMLMDVADPDSTNYGKHYTADEVMEIFAPNQDSVDAVTQWLQAEGISGHRVSRSYNKQWIQFDATIGELETLLRTDYNIYTHRDTGTRKIGTDGYSVPREIQKHVDFIIPAASKLHLGKDDSNRLHRRKTADHRFIVYPEEEEDLEQNEKKCNKFVTPRCIRELYDIPLGTENVAGNNIGLYVDGFPYSQQSLNDFFSNFSSFIPEGTSPVISRVNGGRAKAKPSFGTVETQLDMEMIYPIVYPQNVQAYFLDVQNVPGSPSELPGLFNSFLDAVDGSYCNRTAFGETGDNPKFDPTYPSDHYNGTRMCGTYKPTNVISISYSPAEHQRTVNYDRRQCGEWMKLAMQGVTVVGASGDDGVMGSSDCIKDSDGKRRIFEPYALTNCPYVVGVGSTLVPSNRNFTAGNEVSTRSFPSGGGFSNIYPAPKWQKDAVDQYFKEEPSPYKYYKTKYDRNGGDNGGLFNRAGRGVPDVSAAGDWNVVHWNGKVTTLGGTSASAPIFAAIINRINGERLKASKSTVGFIQPALYANPHVLNDVTEGSNPGCHTNGFKAAKGWDPLTGLGTPNYPKMLKLFMGYQ